MAANTKKPGTELPPDVLEDGDESVWDRWALSPTEENQIEMLAGIDGEIVDQVQITVFVYLIEVTNGKRKPWKIWDGDADSYRAVGLRSLVLEHGSGEYQVRIMVKLPGELRPVVRSNNIYSERLSPAEERKHREIVAAANAPIGAQPAQTGGMDRPVTLQDVATIVTQAITAAMPKQPDTLAMFKEVAGIMATLRPETPAASQGLGIKDVFDMAGTLAELRGSGNSESSGGEMLLGKLIDKFGEPVAALVMDGIKNQKQAEQAAPVDNPAPALPRQPAAPQQEELMPGFTAEQPPANSGQTAQEQKDMGLANAVGFLLPFARNKAGVGPYAEMAFDVLTEDEMGELLAMSDEEIVNKMSSLVPDVKNHSEWFKELAAEIRNLATPEMTTE